jgi:hypothetical protein
MNEKGKSQKKWPTWYYFAIVIILGATYNLIFVDKTASEEQVEEESKVVTSQDSLQSVIDSLQSVIETEDKATVSVDSKIPENDEAVRTPPVAKEKTTPPVAKEKTISGLFMWNGLETGNFAIFNKNGSCVFGILRKGGYVSSRTEGSYVLKGDKLIVSDLYNPNWDRVAEHNGDWIMKSKTSIEQAEGSQGYLWFKQLSFSDLGTKITF